MSDIRTVEWSSQARNQFRKAIVYLKEHSDQGAEAIRLAIIEAIYALPDHPFKFPNDRFKRGQTNEFRAFEVRNYRIAYRIFPDRILIVRIRHTSMEPKHY